MVISQKQIKSNYKKSIFSLPWSITDCNIENIKRMKKLKLNMRCKKMCKMHFFTDTNNNVILTALQSVCANIDAETVVKTVVAVG